MNEGALKIKPLFFFSSFDRVLLIFILMLIRVLD